MATSRATRSRFMYRVSGENSVTTRSRRCAEWDTGYGPDDRMNDRDFAANPPSIRRRLTATAIGGLVVTAVATAAIAALAVSLVVEALMKSSLEETAQALVVLAEHEREVEVLAQGLALPAAPHEEALLWQLRSPEGRVVARSHRAP